MLFDVADQSEGNRYCSFPGHLSNVVSQDVILVEGRFSAQDTRVQPTGRSGESVPAGFSPLVRRSVYNDETQRFSFGYLKLGSFLCGFSVIISHSILVF